MTSCTLSNWAHGKGEEFVLVSTTLKAPTYFVVSPLRRKLHRLGLSVSLSLVTFAFVCALRWCCCFGSVDLVLPLPSPLLFSMFVPLLCPCLFVMVLRAPRPRLEPCLEFCEAARHSVRDLPLALDPTDLVERPGRYDLAKAVEFGLGGVFDSQTSACSWALPSTF